MLENIIARQQTFTIRSVVAVDFGFQLIVVYRDFDWLDAIRWQARWQIRQVETYRLLGENGYEWARMGAKARFLDAVWRACH